MNVRWLLATGHLLALAIGVAAVLMRARALRATRSEADLPPVFVADNWWGVAALLWLGTGLLRAFAGFEKGTTYYLSNPLFHAKLGLFVLVVFLEVWPAVTLVRWRLALRRGQAVDLDNAGRFASLSYVEAGIVLLILPLATAIARGVGL